MATEKKSRAWTAILYPDSLPENWREVLDETHLQWVESPLHDRDLNADGEQKKVHYHVLVMWDGPVTYSCAEKLFHSALHGTVPQACASARGLVRYMVHLDNPEKVQYDVREIKAHGGADIDELLKPTKAYTQQTLKEMTWFIVENKVTEFSDFALYCMTEQEAWFEVLTTHNTLYIKELIKSMRYKLSGAGK